MSFMTYANIVSTLALAVGAASLGWQVITWIDKKKQKNTPKLKAFIKNKPTDNGLGKTIVESRFVIKNIGQCGVTILNCEINGKSITEIEELWDSNVIIGAMLQPQYSIQCFRAPVMNGCNQVMIGSIVKLTYKSDSGKTHSDRVTLSEDVG